VETDFDAKTTNEYTTMSKIEMPTKEDTIKIKDSLVRKKVEPIYHINNFGSIGSCPSTQKSIKTFQMIPYSSS
jgi:hypothetical protein